MPIGTIPVDSIYTPVLKVNYSVENTRVGNQTDFDKLTLEVWTDNTMSSRDAVSLGAKILVDHFTLFTDLSENLTESSVVVEKEEQQTNDLMSITIEELDLSVRSFNCLKRANINTVEDLVSKTQEEIDYARNKKTRTADRPAYGNAPSAGDRSARHRQDGDHRCPRQGDRAYGRENDYAWQGEGPCVLSSGSLVHHP